MSTDRLRREDSPSRAAYFKPQSTLQLPAYAGCYAFQNAVVYKEKHRRGVAYVMWYTATSHRFKLPVLASRLLVSNSATTSACRPGQEVLF